MIRFTGMAASLLLAMSVLPSAQADSAAEDTVRVLTNLSTDEAALIRRAFAEENAAARLVFSHASGNELLAMLDDDSRRGKFDLVLADRPDFAETLRHKAAYLPVTKATDQIPDQLARVDTQDAARSFQSVALSGVGILSNELYLRGYDIPQASSLRQLAAAPYFDQLATISPTRSADMYFFVESVLQQEGWSKGWRTIRMLMGNTRLMADSDEGLGEAIADGEAAAALVSDHIALLREGNRDPVTFAYPEFTAFEPLKVALLRDGRTPELSQSVVDFLQSDSGQRLLLQDEMARLPLNPTVYSRVAADHPSPYRLPESTALLRFDWTLANSRKQVVQSLFDVICTFSLPELVAATDLMHRAAAVMRNNAEVRDLILEAEILLAKLPVDEFEATSASLNKQVEVRRLRKRDDTPLEQKITEWEWDNEVRLNYNEAIALLTRAVNLGRFGH